MNKRILVSQEEKNSILSMHESFKNKGVIKEDDMGMATSSDMSKVYTLKQLGVNEVSYMRYMKGTTPFMVNGVEQKRSTDIKPTDKLSCKDCMIDFVTNNTKKDFTLIFDSNGNAKIKF